MKEMGYLPLAVIMLFMSFSFPLSASAAADSDQIILQMDIDGISNMIPGDIIKEKFQIKNETENRLQISLGDIRCEGSQALAEHLAFSVGLGNDVLCEMYSLAEATQIMMNKEICVDPGGIKSGEITLGLSRDASEKCMSQEIVVMFSLKLRKDDCGTQQQEESSAELPTQNEETGNTESGDASEENYPARTETERSLSNNRENGSSDKTHLYQVIGRGAWSESGDKGNENNIYLSETEVPMQNTGTEKDIQKRKAMQESRYGREKSKDEETVNNESSISQKEQDKEVRTDRKLKLRIREVKKYNIPAASEVLVEQKNDMQLITLGKRNLVWKLTIAGFVSIVFFLFLMGMLVLCRQREERKLVWEEDIGLEGM